MNNEPILVIMAAGMGSRFGGLKQIEPVSGRDEIILDFSLFDAMRAGFKRAIIIIKEENLEIFKSLLENKAAKHMHIDFAFQKLTDIPRDYTVPEGRIKPWGTSHAILAARDLIDAPFAVINADDYYGPAAFKRIYTFLSSACDKRKYDYCMVGYKIENTLTENGHVSRGVCALTPGGNLAGVTERTKIKWQGDKIVFTEDDEKTWQELSRGTTVSMNLWGFTPSFIRECWARFPRFLDSLGENPQKKEYPLPTSVDELIREGKARVKVLTTPDRWYGVTYKEDKDSVVKALQSMKDSGLYPENLWE